MTTEGALNPQAAVGRYVAQFRSINGITLDDFARASKRHGTTWGIASVRRIENGEAPLTLQTMLQLSLTIGELRGSAVALGELFPESGEIALPLHGNAPRGIRAEWLTAVLSGAPVELTPADMGIDAQDIAEKIQRALPTLQDGIARLVRILPDGYDDWDRLENAIGYPEPTLAESRAATRLGVEPFVVTVWARHLWGVSLDEAARDRAGAGSTPQGRGRVSRKLVQEIEQGIHDRQTTKRDGDG